jgi:hypothetical protein
MLAVALSAVIAAVLVITLSGGGSSRTHPSHPRGATGPLTDIQAAASYLGLAPAEVRRRLRGGQTLEQIAAATKGHSASGLKRTLLGKRSARLEREQLSEAERRLKLAQLRGQVAAELRRSRRGIHSRFLAAARYLGLGEATLLTQLRSKHSLGKLAAATPGKSRTGLIDALVKGRREAIEIAVKDHQINAAQARTAISLLRKRVTRAVDRQRY